MLAIAMNPIIICPPCVTRCMLRWSVVLLLAGAIIVLPSCATTRGFGQDVKKVGNKIERGAEKHM